MLVFDTPASIRRWSHEQRAAGCRLAVVPTMGALHAGHVSLVRTAAEFADRIVVTIFVNPLQFDRDADLASYPRPIDDDLQVCTTAGVDAVFAPTASTMYPAGFETHVEPGHLAARLEGAHRPGHFRGVATVVTKLLAATAPDVAVFGEKDYQQLAIVRRLVADLDLGIDVVGAPTVREPDGLAMSSRNTRLSPAERAAAPVVRAALVTAATAYRSGERDGRSLVRVASDVIGSEPLARIDYVDVVDRSTLEPVTAIDRPSAMLAAVWFGDVRLIDHESLEPDPSDVVG